MKTNEETGCVNSPLMLSTLVIIIFQKFLLSQLLNKDDFIIIRKCDEIKSLVSMWSN